MSTRWVTIESLIIVIQKCVFEKNTAERKRRFQTVYSGFFLCVCDLLQKYIDRDIMFQNRYENLTSSSGGKIIYNFNTSYPWIV